MKTDARSKLIEIATQMFATKGFAAVSVRELTDAGKVNISAISYYFTGKDGLYQAVFEEQLSPILQALQLTQSKDSLSPIERLTFYADHIALIHEQRPFLARLMISELANPTEIGGPIIEKHLSQLYQFIQTAVQEGIANGDFREDLNVPYTVVSLTGILNFYFISKPIIQKITPLTDLANTAYTKHAFKIYLYGILHSTVKQ